MKNITKYFLSALILVLVFIVANIAKSPDDENVHVYILNVGQGDSILIQKKDYQILVDAGPGHITLEELGKVMPVLDRKIEQIIITHPHQDHIGAINEVIDRYEVGEIFGSGVLATNSDYIQMLKSIKDENIKFTVPLVGEKMSFTENEEMTFFWPGEEYKEKEIDNLNNSSEVVKLCYFSHCALLMGDLETDGQAQMLAKQTDPSVFSSELLKIAHHGSINGTNQQLLDVVKPKFAAISVGADNQFGHPHAKTLDLLSQNSIPISRTDRDGTIEYIFSKDGISKK